MMWKRMIGLAVFAAAMAAPATAQNMADPTDKVAGEGMPEGWMVRFDPPRRGPAPTAKDVNFRAMGGGFHHNSGPAGIYYRPADAQGSGDFTVTATIAQAKSMAHETYGIWIGGKNLQSDQQNYLYMVFHPQNGTFLINHRTSDARPTRLVPFTESAAINKESATDGSARNTVSIRVHGDMVHFSINGQEVHMLNASSIEDFSTDGLVGMRLNHNLDVHIGEFGVSK